MFRALDRDGAPVDGFAFDGNAVTWAGAEPVEAGIRYELEVDGADWLVPGVFYGENRPEACTRIFPRFTPGHVDVERMESDAWSFRADRCATPAVFAGERGLATREVSPVGQAGVGFAQVGRRAQVVEDGALGQHHEAVREAFRYPQLFLVFSAENLAYPVPECW